LTSGEIDSFVERYVQAIRDQNAAVFVGAGVSIPAGLVNWKGLLKSIAREIGLDVKKEEDLVTLAQFHVNERRGRHGINQALIHEFATRGKLTENHKLLAGLPIVARQRGRAPEEAIKDAALHLELARHWAPRLASATAGLQARAAWTSL
jgi:hypothetical protein